MATDLDAEVLTLGGLDLAGVAELLDLDLGDVDAADQARELHRASGGSPLFLREMQRHAEATGRFPAEGDIPPGIRQAVDRRLAALSAPTIELLGVASVAGPSFDLTVVAMAAGDDERDALDAVDEALAAHLVVEDPDNAGTLAFSHAIVRGALYDEQSESRRTYLHGRIGQALLVRHESDPEAVAGELAYHLMLGAGGRPDPLAAAWCRTAGRLAAAQ